LVLPPPRLMFFLPFDFLSAIDRLAIPASLTMTAGRVWRKRDTRNSWKRALLSNGRRAAEEITVLRDVQL